MPITKKVYSYSNARKQIRRYKKPLPVRQNQKLKNILNANEYKFFDTAITTAGADDAITIISPSLNLMQVGDGSQNRDGNKCLLTSIYIRGTVAFPNSTALSINNISDQVLEYNLVLDKQSNGAVPSVTTIFTANAYNSFMNLDNKKRFRVLKTKKVLLPIAAMVADSTLNTIRHARVERSFEMSLPKLNIPLMYDASTGAITDLSSNNVFLLVKNASPNSSPDVVHDLNARVRFLG